jgi:hypothetical protein
MIEKQGTVAPRRGSSVVVGNGTDWTSDMFGGQFTCGEISEAILRVDGAGSLALGRPWPGDDVADAAYTIKYRTDRLPHVVAIKELQVALAPHIEVIQ